MFKTENELKMSVGARPGVVQDTFVIDMCIVFVDGTRYFVKFMNEAFGQISVIHIKSKSGAVKLSRGYVKWVERQAESKVTKSYRMVAGNIWELAQSLVLLGSVSVLFLTAGMKRIAMLNE